MILCCINDFHLLDFLCGRTDGVGKVQRQVLLGAAGVLGKGARQQRGGVGDEDGAFRQILCQLRVERILLLGILRNGLTILDQDLLLGRCHRIRMTTSST